MGDGCAALDQQSQDRIWEFFQNDQPESFHASRPRLAYLAQKVRETGPVLNIGAGVGQFEAEAIARGIDIYSLDPSERTIEMLRQRLMLGEKAQVGHGQQIPFPSGLFGAVVVSEVLEHLSPAESARVVAEIGRVLKPDGLLAGTVPARERLEDQQTICPHCGRQFHPWGHQQSFDCEKIRALMLPGFQPLDIFERPFVAWQTLNWKGQLLSAAKLGLWRLGIHGSQENVVFIGRRCPGSA
jgi:SAM-dependent methyltransferase